MRILCATLFVFGLGLVAADPVPRIDPTPTVPAPKGYVCYPAKAAPIIDGSLDDAIWKAVPWTDDFTDIEGDKRPKPHHRTRVKMAWDNEALYIAAELDEPHVWGTLTKHDSVIFHDPDFEVFLDPDGDNHTYGELELNALNTTWDLLLTKPYRDGGLAVNAWEITDLKTAVKVHGTINDPSDTDRGWTVEIRWPWKSLAELNRVPVPPKDGNQWRINFSRVEWDFKVVNGKYEVIKDRKEHNWVWSPQGVIDMHRPERWGYLQFSTAEPGKTEYKVDPSGATRDALHLAYYAQTNHYFQHKKYASTAEQLGLKDTIAFEITKSSFEARLDGWVITNDSRIRSEK